MIQHCVNMSAAAARDPQSLSGTASRQECACLRQVRRSSLTVSARTLRWSRPWAAVVCGLLSVTYRPVSLCRLTTNLLPPPEPHVENSSDQTWRILTVFAHVCTFCTLDIGSPLSRTWHADDARELQSARLKQRDSAASHPRQWVPDWRDVHPRCWLWAGAGCESPVSAVTRAQGSAVPCGQATTRMLARSGRGCERFSSSAGGIFRVCMVPGLPCRPRCPRQQACVVEVDLALREVDWRAQQHMHAAVGAFHGVACTKSPSLMHLQAAPWTAQALAAHRSQFTTVSSTVRAK